MRLDGWERRLLEIVAAVPERAYQLGEHDCFRLVCRVVEALTGVDRWPELSGYTTERESIAVIAAHGETFEAAFDWFFGAPSVDVRCARRGDICVARNADGGKPLGVCLGVETAFLAPEGLVYAPTLSCLRSWRVG